MIYCDVVVLQNCVDFMKSEPSSCSDSCRALNGDENQCIDIKVEEDTGVEVEHGRVAVTCMSVKCTSGEFCICSLLSTFYRYLVCTGFCSGPSLSLSYQ